MTFRTASEMCLPRGKDSRRTSEPHPTMKRDHLMVRQACKRGDLLAQHPPTRRPRLSGVRATGLAQPRTAIPLGLTGRTMSRIGIGGRHSIPRGGRSDPLRRRSSPSSRNRRGQTYGVRPSLSPSVFSGHLTSPRRAEVLGRWGSRRVRPLLGIRLGQKP